MKRLAVILTLVIFLCLTHLIAGGFSDGVSRTGKSASNAVKVIVKNSDGISQKTSALNIYQQFKNSLSRMFCSFAYIVNAVFNRITTQVRVPLGILVMHIEAIDFVAGSVSSLLKAISNGLFILNFSVARFFANVFYYVYALVNVVVTAVKFVKNMIYVASNLIGNVVVRIKDTLLSFVCQNKVKQIAETKKIHYPRIFSIAGIRCTLAQLPGLAADYIGKFAHRFTNVVTFAVNGIGLVAEGVNTFVKAIYIALRPFRITKIFARIFKYISIIVDYIVKPIELLKNAINGATEAFDNGLHWIKNRPLIWGCKK